MHVNRTAQRERIILFMPVDASESHPYPSQYVFEWRMKDGTAITIRPIRPADEAAMVRFHTTLSERSVYLRYFCTLSFSTRVEHERLVHICFPEYDHEMAF